MSNTADQLEAAAGWARRWLVALLLGCYGFAAVLPGPGRWLRDWEFSLTPDGAPVRLLLMLVGVLLFCGSISIDARRILDLLRSPGAVVLALLGVWGPPVAVVTLCNALTPWWLQPADALGLGVGLALAGSMPVANSAVAWTQQSSRHSKSERTTVSGLAWTIGLVVLTITISPWVTPEMLWLSGLSLSAADAAAADELVAQFTGGVFVFWVLGPTLLGFVVRWLAGADRVTGWRPVLSLASAVALLLVNYANASTALPRFAAEPDLLLLATTLLAAALLPLTGHTVSWVLAPLARLPSRDRAAWRYSLGMKNTGLALGLAGAALGDQPVAVLAILMTTLTQHLVAGATHTRMSQKQQPSAKTP